MIYLVDPANLMSATKEGCIIFCKKYVNPCPLDFAEPLYGITT